MLFCLLCCFISQPKQIHEIKDFLLTARRKDARSVKIKRSKDVVKFKDLSFALWKGFLVEIIFLDVIQLLVMASCMNLSPFWSSGYETFYSGTGYLLLFRHIEYDLIMNGQKVLDQNL
uniref:Uncharacterized protein n=1 Tax=Lactuca sativa TaxID=4236 RepID=A0A9R1XJB1_LACSA|nr:hypothetical protein LSAT_V11C300109870 [Lactuca sativa]